MTDNSFPASKPSISIIVPALNEESNLEPTIRAIFNAMGNRFSAYEILIFDDCSSDRTGENANRLAETNENIKVIHNERNMGLGFNYRKGVELAQKEYIVMIHGDNQTTERSITDMFKLIGVADMVIPYIANDCIRPLHRQIISRMFVAIMNVLTGLRLKHYNGPVILKRDFLKKVQITTSGFAYQAQTLTRLIKLGYSYVEVGTYLQRSKHRKSKAFKPKNIISVLKAMAQLTWEVRVKERRRFNQPVRKIEV